MALGPSLYRSLHNSHKIPGNLLCMPNKGLLTIEKNIKANTQERM